MKRQDMTVEQLLGEIKDHQEILLSLQEELNTRARLQHYTETQFNELALVAKEGIILVESALPGVLLTPPWFEKRDELVGRARHLIQDAY